MIPAPRVEQIDTPTHHQPAPESLGRAATEAPNLDFLEADEAITIEAALQYMSDYDPAAGQALSLARDLRANAVGVTMTAQSPVVEFAAQAGIEELTVDKVNELEQE